MPSNQYRKVVYFIMAHQPTGGVVQPNMDSLSLLSYFFQILYIHFSRLFQGRSQDCSRGGASEPLTGGLKPPSF